MPVRSLLPISPRDVAAAGLCIGCGSCVAQANTQTGSKTLPLPEPQALPPGRDNRDLAAGWEIRPLPADEAACAGHPQMELDRYGHLKPVGPAGWLRHRSATLARMCPFAPGAR